MIRNEPVIHIIQARYLLAGALFFLTLTLIIIILIYVQLYLKRRRSDAASAVHEQINEWIGGALMEADEKPFPLTAQLKQYMKKERNREGLIDNLITIRKNITGTAASRIVTLYLQLGLKEDSLKRFRSVIWHQKTKGIYELYMMDQEAELPDIYIYTNSANENVRMEAQIAIVGFQGFEGLTFLDTLEFPLHEWQQLKLLEQLSTLDTVYMDHLPVWLQSENEYVVHFALKLADIYRQMDVHDLVLSQLSHPADKIRFQAIRTLGRIANEQTPDILVARYACETPGNKREILKQLSVIAHAAHIPFLEEALLDDSDTIKLEAITAIALLDDTRNLMDKYGTDATMISIIKQVQYEQAL